MEQERIISTMETSDLNPSLRGGPTTEYAKVQKISILEDVKSVKAKITLPQTRHTSFKNGFVNFYLGLDEMEAGISTVAWKDKWHWFCNHKKDGATNGDDGAFTQYGYGTVRELEIKIVGTTLEFYVDGEKERTTKFIGDKSNARFIFGAGIDISTTIGGMNPSNSAEKLGVFPAFHNAATLSNMSYVTTGGVTKNVNKANSNVRIESPIKWPIIGGVAYPCQKPEYHTVDKSQFSSGIVHASIK